MRHYKLDDKGEPVPVDNVLDLAEAFEKQERTVKRERIGKSEVSTVFLGINHAFTSDEPPVLWETMVFGGPLDQEQDRCGGSREQAEAMHQRMCERVRKGPL